MADITIDIRGISSSGGDDNRRDKREEKQDTEEEKRMDGNMSREEQKRVAEERKQKTVEDLVNSVDDNTKERDDVNKQQTRVAEEARGNIREQTSTSARERISDTDVTERTADKPRMTSNNYTVAEGEYSVDDRGSRFRAQVQQQEETDETQAQISSPQEPSADVSRKSVQESGVLPPNDRLLNEVRQAIITQGAIYTPGTRGYRQIINQVYQQQLSSTNEEITQRYDAKRAAVDEKIDAVITETREKYSKPMEEELDGVTSERKRKKITQRYGEMIDEEIEKRVSPYEQELKNINEQEAAERVDAERELKEAIDELTTAILKSGTLDPESYLGQLRIQRQEAIFERDTAADEETAREAASRVRDLDEQIKSVTEGEREQTEDTGRDINFSNRVLQTLLGSNQMISGIANRNIGSMIMGGGQAVTSMLGLSDESASKALAWLQPFAFVGSMLTQEGLKSDQMAGLAALYRNNIQQGGGTQSIEDTRTELYNRINSLNFSGFSITEMGLSAPEFAQSAERRMSQRGISEYGLFETYMQEALERVFSLTRGSLGEAGKYDRYGINITDAISNLVSRLERIDNSGVSQGNYARVQEYLGIQQQLMSNYYRFQNEPDYMAANRDIEAFTKLGSGYQIDSRTAGDIQSVQNSIMNPQNERMRSILYGVVEQAVPEYNGTRTAGRVDIIDQILNDPKYQGIVEKAFFGQLENMYGGFDTPMGYLMIKSLLPGVESPERRKAIFEGVSSGEAGKVLADTEYEKKFGTPFENQQQMLQYSGQVKGYVSQMTDILIKMSDEIFGTASKLEKIVNNVSKISEGNIRGLFQ